MILTTILNNSIFLIFLWVVIFAFSLIICLSIGKLAIIWISIGSVLAIIFAICDIKWYFQLIIFILTSSLSLPKINVKP